MPDKNFIVNNIIQFSDSDLAGFINQGFITLEDIKSLIAPPRQIAIKKMVGLNPTKPSLSPDPPSPPHFEDNESVKDDNDWNIARNENTQDAYQTYLNNHPQGKYRSQAQQAYYQLGSSLNGWEQIDKNNLDALYTWINEHPQGSAHYDDAMSLIAQIETFMGKPLDQLFKFIENTDANKNISSWDKVEMICSRIKDHLGLHPADKEQLILKIDNNHNYFDAPVFKQLFQDGIFNFSDLTRLGIDNEVFQVLINGEIGEDILPPANPLSSISKVCTEIYFWGIPSSGKTCALGTIMSMAERSGNFKASDCQGKEYLGVLCKMFKEGKVGVLPGSTPTNATFEMGFDIEGADNKTHPITCIDFAGEMLRIIYEDSVGTVLDDEDTDCLDSFDSVLVSQRKTNRKMHFFVLEYGAESKKVYSKYKPGVWYAQNDLVANAVSYLENKSIFNKDTDAIGIIITKVDSLRMGEAEMYQHLDQYLNTNYKSFINNLEKICDDAGMGKVKKIPFSIGDVWFRQYCKLNSQYAQKFIDNVFVALTKGFSQKKLAKIAKR